MLKKGEHNEGGHWKISRCDLESLHLYMYIGRVPASRSL